MVHRIINFLVQRFHTFESNLSVEGLGMDFGRTVGRGFENTVHLWRTVRRQAAKCDTSQGALRQKSQPCNSQETAPAACEMPLERVRVAATRGAALLRGIPAYSHRPFGTSKTRLNKPAIRQSASRARRDCLRLTFAPEILEAQRYVREESLQRHCRFA